MKLDNKECSIFKHSSCNNSWKEMDRDTIFQIGQRDEILVDFLKPFKPHKKWKFM